MNIKEKDLKSKRAKRSQLDEVRKMNIKQKDLKSKRAKRSQLDEVTKMNIKEKDLKSKRAKRSQLDEVTKMNIRVDDTASRKRKRSQHDEQERNRITNIETSSRKKKRLLSSFDFENSYSKSLKDFPVYFCCCCHRTWYRTNVQVVNEEKYKDTDEALLRDCLTDKLSFDNVRYICSSCHSNLMKKKIPAMSVSNNLHLHKIPVELKDLGELESVLISQRIIFFKMVNLPRGRQRGVIGSFVNVPIDTESVCTSLPRTPDQAGIIPLKLKRKASYKGHHLHQNIRPNHVNDALIWLVNHNELYRNINVTRDWLQQCQEDNSELWTSLFDEGTDLHNDGNEENQSTCQENSSNKDKNIQTTANVENNDQQHQCDDVVPSAIQDPQEKVRGLQYDTCLHPTNPVASGEKQYAMAPGEGKMPLDPFLDKQSEALAFPTLFPDGHHTLFGDEEKNPRKVKLTSKKYFIQRITNADNRFASCVPYLFYALNVCEKEQIQNSIKCSSQES
jgi:hypothetical protein